MALFIDSGPVSAEDFLRHVPRDKWRELMLARRSFLEVKLSHDCRCLVQFVADAEQMFSELGFADIGTMIRDGYGLEPAEIAVAVEWLRLNPPDEPISLPAILGKQGRPPKDKPCNARFTYGSRDHWMARLSRDGFADLVDRVIAGELSANAAAIEAGFRKRPTPFEQATKLLSKLTIEELAALDGMIHQRRCELYPDYWGARSSQTRSESFEGDRPPR